MESANLKIDDIKKSISQDIDKSQQEDDDVESHQEDIDNETWENELYIDEEDNE